jgi:type 1 glutamine amidotransferase
MNLLFGALVCSAIVAAALPPFETAPRFAVLVFARTAGFHHDSIPAGIQAIRALGTQYNFDVDDTTDVAAFTDQSLARYRAVVFLNTTGDVFGPPEQAAFENFIRNGGGFVGIHSAADTEYDWPWYGRLLGTYFASHPEIQSGKLKIVDANHPSTETLPNEWIRTDEWYNFREDPSPNVGVLLAIDETSYSGGDMGPNHPIAWRHSFEGGRAWYTAMGHTIESYTEPLFLAHVAGGILWAANVQRPAAAPLPIREVESGNIRTGYLVITPDIGSPAPATTLTFGLLRNGIVQSQAGIIGLPLTTDASVFAELNLDIGRNVGVAVANPTDNVANLMMTLRGSDGSASGNPVALTLVAHQQVAKFVSELFSGTIDRSFIGSVRIQSSSPVSVSALRFSGTNISTLAITNNAVSAGPVVFPQFVVGGGWATQLAFVNTSPAAVTGRFDVFDDSGKPMAVGLNGFSQSGYTYSIPAGGALVFAPRDANGQSPM